MQSFYQKKSLILSIVFFIIFFVIFIFLYKNILGNEEVALSMEKEWQTENSKRKDVKNLLDFINSIDNERDLLNTHFVKSSDLVPFLNTIEKLAEDVNLKSEVSSVDIPKTSNVLVVEMRAVGSFENIYKLITLLENSQYELDFNAVDLRTDDLTTTKNSEWNAVFQIKLLSFVN